MSEAFAVFDVDKDGYITKSERRQVMNRLGENLTDAQLDAMIKEADSDKDGKIDINEFRSLMKFSVCKINTAHRKTQLKQTSFLSFQLLQIGSSLTRYHRYPLLFQRLLRQCIWTVHTRL